MSALIQLLQDLTVTLLILVFVDFIRLVM